MRCSNPNCRRPTSGPASDPRRAVNIGVAAHITAASPGGPRYERGLSTTARGSVENAIWLCQDCAKLIDSNPEFFTIHTLHKWKHLTEKAAAVDLKAVPPKDMPSSIEELLRIVDARACTILQDMERAKEQAVRWLTEHQSMLAFYLPTARGSEPFGVRIDPATLFFDEVFGGWTATSVQNLREQLDSLTHSFEELHALYKQELQAGHYVAAHEIVSHIHAVLEKHRRRSTPPGGDRPSHQYYIGRPDVAARMWARQTALWNHERYPGLVPIDLLSRLPEDASPFLLANGRSSENRDKVVNWEQMEGT